MSEIRFHLMRDGNTLSIHDRPEDAADAYHAAQAATWWAEIIGPKLDIWGWADRFTIGIFEDGVEIDGDRQLRDRVNNAVNGRYLQAPAGFYREPRDLSEVVPPTDEETPAVIAAAKRSLREGWDRFLLTGNIHGPHRGDWGGGPATVFGNYGVYTLRFVALYRHRDDRWVGLGWSQVRRLAREGRQLTLEVAA